MLEIVIVRFVTYCVLVVSLCQPTVAQSQAFICFPQASGGVTFNTTTQRWVGTTFTVPERWIVRRVTNEDRERLDETLRRLGYQLNIFAELRDAAGWVEVPGRDLPILGCESGFGAGPRVVSCSDAVSIFRMSTTTLRFAYATINSADLIQEGRTPNAMAGICSRL